MTEMDPRVSFSQIAGLFGYDPLTVIAVYVVAEEVTIRFRLASAAPGGYAVMETGFPVTPGLWALLSQMASSYGYDPEQVISVRIDQHESVIRYLSPLTDSVPRSIQADLFRVLTPPPAPAWADTDPGRSPGI